MSSANNVRRPGLPSNPRAAQAARVFPSSAPPPPQIREKRSMPSIATPRSVPSDNSGRARLQSLRQQPAPRSGHPRRHHVSASTSSASSASGSSLRSSASSSLSSTNLSSQRSSVTSLSESIDSEVAKNEDSTAKPFWHGQAYSIDGTSVWKSVTGVASLVSQEVNKVWATGIPPLNATTTGGRDEDESKHLLNVMRQYHLSKAATPGDLPDWLFNGRERGARGVPAESRPSLGHLTHDQRLASRTSESAQNEHSSARGPRLSSGTSSASDRLRAKRSPHRLPSKV